MEREFFLLHFPLDPKKIKNKWVNKNSRRSTLKGSREWENDKRKKKLVVEAADEDRMTISVKQTLQNVLRLMFFNGKRVAIKVESFLQ